MSQFKGKKPATKELEATIQGQAKTITDLNNDLHLMADMLEKEQNTVRVPKTLTVVQYNSLIDFLNENRPEPCYPKEVPDKVDEPKLEGMVKPLQIVKDTESNSHVN